MKQGTLSILFVDDEAKVLHGLRRMLRRMRGAWEMCFAPSAAEALEAFAGTSFDVVVSDMRMPGMDGAEFLSEIARSHPGVARIVLSGHAEKEVILRTVGPAHRYVSKPCDADVLIETVQRATAIRSILGNQDLRDLVYGTSSLPSVPALYSRLVADLGGEGLAARAAGEVVAQDVAMTAKVLQIVNSAFFGQPVSMTDPVAAAGHLGTETLRDLALAAEVFRPAEGCRGFDTERYRARALATARAARAIAAAEAVDSQTVEASFQAGMLHDIGRLVLAQDAATDWDEVEAAARRRGVPVTVLEEELLGTTHAEVGGCLLGLWGLPDVLVEAVTFHHAPYALPGRGFSPMLAVHVASAVLDEGGGAAASGTGRIDEECLEVLGLRDRLPEWRGLCAGMVEEGAV